MSGKNTKTAGQAAQAQADSPPTTPGAAPTTPASDASAADAHDSNDEGEHDEHDSEDEGEHDEYDSEDESEHDDETNAVLRELVRQLQADKTELQQQLTAERQRSGEQAADLNVAENLIEDLQTRLKRADARQAQSDAVIVSHGEADYKVLAPKFQFEGKVYQADDLKDDAALVARLVAAEVGFLHPVPAAQ